MKFRKNLLNLHHFLNFQETNRSLEKRLKSFDSFDYFDLKHGKVKLSINHITYQNFKSVLRPLIRFILDV